MSIFDTLSDGITSLFDDPASIFDSSSSLNKIAGAAVKGYQATQAQAKDRMSSDNALLNIIERGTHTQPTDQSFKSHPNQKYGAANYSADPEAITQAWRSYLLGVTGDSKVVPGERYTGKNVS